VTGFGFAFSRARFQNTVTVIRKAAGCGFGLRWQGGSRDTAFGRSRPVRTDEIVRARESGVALRFPPQSKMPFTNQRPSHFQTATSLLNVLAKAGCKPALRQNHCQVICMFIGWPFVGGGVGLLT